jgi:phage terminase large subunit-like protein
VRHVGAFSRLEDEMTNFTGSPGETSPDRLDALVWAVSDLLLARSSPSPSIRIPH